MSTSTRPSTPTTPRATGSIGTSTRPSIRMTTMPRATRLLPTSTRRSTPTTPRATPPSTSTRPSTPTTTSRRRKLARRGEGSPDDLLAESRGLRRRLQYSEALAMARAAVTAHQATGASGLQLAESHLLCGQLEEDLGDLDAAEAAYLAAAAAAEPAPLPGRHGVRVRALARLASVLRDRGAIAEADAALADALASAETNLPDGLDHAEGVAEQSRQLMEHGAREDAERLARRAVAMAEAAPPSVAREETRTRALS